MATLLSVSTGNLSATASWGVVEPTSFQGIPNATLTATPALSTLYTGTAFTLASSVTVAGVALQLSGRVVAPTGTINVQLYDVTGATILGQVTINMSDLPNSQGVGANHIDWVYFKFASPVTTVAGRSHAIRIQMSVISQISWYYTTSTTNPNRALVTTTNQAPVTSDVLIIAGQYTGAGAFTTNTITMDLPSITLGNIWVSTLGILQHITTSSTAMSLSGYLVIGTGGQYRIGISLAPIPSIYSVTLTMNCTTALQYPIWVYGSMTTYGEGFTGFPTTKVIATKLAADVIVGATTSTTSTATGWKNGDIIAVPSTTRTAAQYEVKTLNSDASGTTLTHNAYTNAHGGNTTTKVQADIVNLTRNILITGAGVILANKTNIQMFPTSRTQFYYTQFRYMGTGITIANSGICVNALTTAVNPGDNFMGTFSATFTMQYCSMTDGTQALANTANTALQTANSTGTSISNNVFYGLGWSATTVSTIIVTEIDDGNYIIGCLATTQALLSTTMGSNNVIASNVTTTAGATTGFVNNATNNSFYSNSSIGVVISNPLTTGNVNLSNFIIWRNNTYGLRIDISAAGYQRNNIISFTGLYCFGNTTASLLTLTRIFEKVYFVDSFFYGGSTLIQPTHFIPGPIVDSIYYNNCYFGYSDTSLTSSPFSGFILQNPLPGISKVFNNCYFNGSEVSATVGTPPINMSGSYISLNHNGVTASNKQWFSNGTITTDSVIYLSGSKSLRLTPNNALYKLTTPLVKVPVKIGTTCTMSVRLRRSLVGDGVAYNGAPPRLMYAFNPILGNLTEVGFTPLSYVVGAWENLTYTTATFSNDGVAEFYVDCDGTAGWINVDDWSVTTSVDSRGNDYWDVNGTYVEPDFKNPIKSYTFIN